MKQTELNRRILTFFILMLVTTFLVSEARSEYVQVTKINIENDDKHILVSYKISGAFNEILIQRIESGLPTEFTFRLKVIMNRPPWVEKKLIEKKIVNKVTYDNITGKYSVNVKVDNEEREYVFTDIEKMQEKMSHIKDFPIIDIDKLVPHRDYFLKIKGELEEENKLFFPLNFLLSFFSKDFSTGWKISDTFSIDKIERLKEKFGKNKE